MDLSFGWSELIALLSAIIAALSLVDAKRSRQSAKDAHELAERSATAAETSAEAAEKHAEISQELFEAGKVRIAYEKDYSNTEPRALTNPENSGFLVNLGSHNAYDVHWDSEKIRMDSKVNRLPVLSPGVRLPMFLSIPNAVTDTRVNVHYRTEPEGPIQTVLLVL